MGVDVVVPAHNEATRIGAVLPAIAGAPSLGKLIVVCDACEDNTAEVAYAWADLIVYSSAGNKGSAMAAGLAHVDTTLVTFMDADLVGLRWPQVEALLTWPPERGQVVARRGADVTGAHRGRLVNKAIGNLPSISGERRVPTWLARSVHLAGSGWRAETLLNVAIARHHLPWRHLVFEGVRNSSKIVAHPVGWADEAARVAAVTAQYGPDLHRYATHPDG